MRKLLVMLCLGVLVAVPASAFGMDTTPKREIVKSAWKLQLRPVSETFLNGEPVIFEMLVENVSGTPQYFLPWRDIDIANEGRVGIEYRIFRNGARLVGGSGGVYEPAAWSPILRKAGHRSIYRSAASILLPIAGLGRYKVTANISVEQDGPVVWQTECEFKIISAEEAGKRILTADDKLAAQRLILQLGHDKWKEREAAVSGILKLGRKVLPLVAEATKSEDPEVRWRAKTIEKALTEKPRKPENTEKVTVIMTLEPDVVVDGMTVVEDREAADRFRSIARKAFKRGDAATAADNILKAIKAGDTSMMTARNATLTLAAVGRFEDLLPIAEALLKQDPKDGGVVTAYAHACYCLARDEDAYKSYLRALQLGEPADYLVLWAVATGSLVGKDEKEAAMKHLRSLARKLKGREWLAPMLSFYAGDISEVELRKAMESGDPDIAKERACEGYYYLGVYKRMAGDREAAVKLFEQCIENTVPSFLEPFLAVEELRRLTGKLRKLPKEN